MPGPVALLPLLAAAAAGHVAQRLNVPLAWVLGPLLTTAVASIMGFRIVAPLAGRRFGQVTIGASIGLNITDGIALLILSWLPAMLVTAALAVALGGLLSVPYGRVSGIDGKTAYYAMMPGGLSEMANLGSAAGARSEPVAIAQALRVAIIVCTLPPVIIALDIHGTDTSALSRPILDAGSVVLVLLVGLAGVGAMRFVALNNPWMIGALTAVGAATATGLFDGRLPLSLFWLGQFLIGIAVGARFKREDVVRLPRVIVATAVFVLVMAALLFGYAALLSWIGGFDIASATLATSPGGFAEMAITAQTLHLSVGLVTSFHVVRAFIVNGFATHAYKAMERIGVLKSPNSLD